MTSEIPPNPADFRSMQEWAEKLYEYFVAQTRIGADNDPLPILLAHRQGGLTERAATDGILMYDPSTGKVVVSKDGAFEPLAFDTS